MGGGLMQLVAYGSQDIYLTGNPQITFFKVVYRRHTNFSMELIQQTLAGSSNRNSKQTCTVFRNGDLIMDIWISENSITSIEGEIYEYINNVDLFIGGQLIDCHYGDWNAVWWNLTTPESKVNGLRNMFIGQSGSSDVGANNSSYFYYPLNFWFCKNPGLSLPIIALQYHEVELQITWGSSSIVSNPEVWINYVYLDTDERRRFAQVSHEYLIEQLQRDTFNGNKNTFDLNFNHPVKELIWVNDITFTSTGATASFAPIRCTSNCTNNTKLSASGEGPYNNADATKCKLVLNGYDRFNSKEMKYFKTCEPMKYHTRIPSSGNRFIYSKSFGFADILQAGSIIYNALKPVRIISFEIIFTVAPNIGVTLTLGANNGDATDVDGNYDQLGSTTASISSVGRTTISLPNDETVCIAHGKHIILDASADLTVGAGIITMELEEIPLLIAGKSTQLSNIYCYSFALKPEEHQPSGTCNFSRIDAAQLIFDDNVGDSNTTLKIFAINYNILRIMSGMGGLAYSN
jgi:hypothetical protein